MEPVRPSPGAVPRPDAPSPGGERAAPPQDAPSSLGAHPAPQRPLGRSAPRTPGSPAAPPRALTPPRGVTAPRRGFPRRSPQRPPHLTDGPRGPRAPQLLTGSESAAARAPPTPQARERRGGAGAAPEVALRPAPDAPGGGAARGRGLRARALPPLGPEKRVGGATRRRGYGRGPEEAGLRGGASGPARPRVPGGPCSWDVGPPRRPRPAPLGGSGRNHGLSSPFIPPVARMGCKVPLSPPDPDLGHLDAKDVAS
ncbi:proline-rich protein 2-like [Bubalus kerabau]|uniref:proline-rich protein 2-like n=1 Tax=Bubalus carabanensis TaxID=3119969 RepID=UPI00244E8316|nr:proline-rich protein 2-like [Bubalus carabanensis]